MKFYKFKYLSFIGYIFLLLLAFTFLFIFAYNTFHVYQDSYEYLLTATNLIHNGKLDLMGFNAKYYATPFYLSRNAYSILIALVGGLFSNTDLTTISKWINITLFFTSFSSLILFGVRKFKSKGILLTVLSIFLFSYSNIFWNQIIVSDFLAQLIIVLSLIYYSQKKHILVLDYLFIIITLFVRIELILPIIALLLINDRKIRDILVKLFVSGLIYLLVLDLLVTDLFKYISFSFNSLNISNLNITFLIIPVLIILALVLFRKNIPNSNFKYWTILILFTSLGAVFLDNHNISKTLLDLQFLIIHDLPVFILFLFLIGYIIKDRINNIKINMYLFIFISGIFTYHFYFQHLVILLPFLIFAAFELLYNIELDKKYNSIFISILILIVFLTTLVSFLNYRINKPDLFSTIDYSNPLFSNCFSNSKPIVTSFLFPLIYSNYSSSFNIEGYNKVIEDNKNYLLNENDFNNTQISKKGFTKVTYNGSLLIINTSSYNPSVYIRCD